MIDENHIEKAFILHDDSILNFDRKNFFEKESSFLNGVNQLNEVKIKVRKIICSLKSIKGVFYIDEQENVNKYWRWRKFC